jgi:hypothetical protein
MGIVLVSMALGHVFSEYFGFLCQFLFYQLLHIIIMIIIIIIRGLIK